MGSGSKSLKPSYVVLGRVGAPFGVRGWVHFQSFTEPPKNLLNYRNWLLQLPGREEWKPIRVTEMKPHGKNFVALLEGVADRDEAALWTQALIGVEQDALPALSEGEFYWAELIGLEVITDTGSNLGTVTELFETGANDVLVVKGQDKPETLIPYVPDEVILSVDLERGIITVHWEEEPS